MIEKAQKLLEKRVGRIRRAMDLKEADRVPVAPYFSSVMERMYGSSYKDIYYDYDKAGDAVVKFYKDHPQCDVHYFEGFISGKANELAGSQMIDWPGRPGTKVSDYSSHQVIEREFMMPEEYPELLNDFTGFMLRKYIPRAFQNLKGMAGMTLNPSHILNTASLLPPLCTSEILETYRLLGQIAQEDQKAAEAVGKCLNALTELGVPHMMSAVSEAPYDILGDYYRGTMGIFEDLMENEDYIEAACEMFADQQIEALKYMKDLNMPLKHVQFPLHKAMDGFMSNEQYEKLYWKPLQKIMIALIDMDVTPYIYTEGPYDTRLEFLADVPKGKVLYHFEKVDMREAKKILGDVACISGNLSISLMEFGKKEDVEEEVKRLLDICAPGGGYIFDFSGALENAKPENLDAMFETLERYGSY